MRRIIGLISLAALVATPLLAQTPPQQGAPYTPQPLSPTEERNLGMIAHLVPAVLLPQPEGS